MCSKIWGPLVYVLATTLTLFLCTMRLNNLPEVAQLEITDAWNSGFPAMAQNPLTLLLVPLLLGQVFQVNGPQVQKCLILCRKHPI